MKNRTARLAALMLALVLLLGTAVPAAAAESDVAAAVERVRQAAARFDSEVDVSDLNLSVEETCAFLDRLCVDADIFQFYKYSYLYNNQGKVSKIGLEYRADITPERVSQTLEAADRIVAECVLPGMDDLQKLMVLHDYLALHVEYEGDEYNPETTSPTSYTPYGALVLQVAVCQGYAMAYQLLLRRCGIESSYASSDAMNHGWCIVKLYGQWYHVDVTWDDPTPDRLGRVGHSYFLISDEAISDADHRHHDWAAVAECTDTTLDEGTFWGDAEVPILNTPIIFTDAGTLWFLEEEGDYSDQVIALIRRDWSTGEETVAAVVSDYWPVWGQNRHYTSAYSGLCLWDRRLFFTDSTHIYSYDPADDTFETEFTYDAHDGYFYGLLARDEDLLVLVQTGPKETGTIYSYDPERKYADPARNPFTDVHQTDYFFEPVVWAFENGVTSGTTATTFSPADACTRGQVVTFLWRAMGCPVPESDENPFADVPEDAYYRDAVLWAVEQGVTVGTGSDASGNPLFSPAAECTNAHILTFLWRAVTGGAASAYGEWYSEPLDWAAQLGLLQSTALDSGTGSAQSLCPRCDVVTFLWRAAQG